MQPQKCDKDVPKQANTQARANLEGSGERQKLGVAFATRRDDHPMQNGPQRGVLPESHVGVPHLDQAGPFAVVFEHGNVGMARHMRVGGVGVLVSKQK